MQRTAEPARPATAEARRTPRQGDPASFRFSPACTQTGQQRAGAHTGDGRRGMRVRQIQAQRTPTISRSRTQGRNRQRTSRRPPSTPSRPHCARSKGRASWRRGVRTVPGETETHWATQTPQRFEHTTSGEAVVNHAPSWPWDQPFLHATSEIVVNSKRTRTDSCRPRSSKADAGPWRPARRTMTLLD